MSAHESFFNRFITNLTSTDHINGRSYVVIGVISVISYILCLSTSEYIVKYRRVVNRWCLVPCKTDQCNDMQKNIKGSKYFINDDMGDQPFCPVSPFEISHILFHIPVGYYFNFYYSLGFGILFEVFEKYQFECESYTDIICNIIGALIGVAIRTASR
jgi:hypothetical protein